MENNTKPYVKRITYVALFVAIISVLAQISIPTPIMPLTLQIFAVALCGFVLNKKYSVITVIVYLLLGTVGVPVFANLKGGFYILISYTGGFLWGFIPFVFLCSVSKGKSAIPLSILGLILCYILGITQYYIISQTSVWYIFLPPLLKDIILVIAAYFVATRVNKIIKKHL